MTSNDLRAEYGADQSTDSEAGDYDGPVNQGVVRSLVVEVAQQKCLRVVHDASAVAKLEGASKCDDENSNEQGGVDALLFCGCVAIIIADFGGIERGSFSRQVMLLAD